MPELPEVETIRRQLATVLEGKKIRAVEVRLPKLIKGSAVLFKKHVVGAAITEVRRRAKLLIFGLSNGCSIIVHLKLTGQLIYQKKKVVAVGGHPIKDGHKNLPHRYTHLIVTFTDGGQLFFNDLRQFGYWKLVKTAELEKLFQEGTFGPEPLDEAFTLDVFRALLARRRTTNIKPLLMDQSFIAGVGNIYATEACFYAGVKPTRPASQLKPAEIAKLFTALKTILRQAIAKQGASADTYVDAYGQPGEYVPFLKVYGRGGQPCGRCGTTIQSISLGGRGTTFCPHCQPR